MTPPSRKYIGLLNPPPLNPDKQTVPSLLVGSEVAARDFATQLALHGDPDAACLLVPPADVPQTRYELARTLENSGHTNCSAAAESVDRIPELLQAGVFTALHNANTPQLHALSYLRERFSPRPIPVTCTPHGFGHPAALWDFFTRLLLTPTLPCDSVIYTSQAARTAFVNCLNQAGEGLRESGVTLPNDGFRLDVLPLGVDTDLYRPRDKAQIWKRVVGRYGILWNELNAVAAQSSLSPQKSALLLQPRYKDNFGHFATQPNAP